MVERALLLRGPRLPDPRPRSAPESGAAPPPALILGGQGGSRSLALGARFADEYNTFNKTPEECRVIRRELDDLCRREGRERIPLSLMTGLLVGQDEVDLLDRAARLAEWRGHAGGTESFLEALPQSFMTGTPDEVTERLGELAEAGVERVMLQHHLHRELDVVELVGRRLAAAVA